jgi:ABC-type uncharacterized transport system ATPase subunit
MSIQWGSRLVVVFSDAAAKAGFVRRLLGAEPIDESDVVTKLRAMGPIGYVSAASTFLSPLPVRENVSFPALYRETVAADEVSGRLARWCQFADIPLDLPARQTIDLTARERIQASFLQACLPEPELLVLDAVFDSLAGADQAAVARMADAFHRRYPLRCSIYLGYAAPPEHLYPATSILTQTGDLPCAA